MDELQLSEEEIQQMIAMIPKGPDGKPLPPPHPDTAFGQTGERGLDGEPDEHVSQEDVDTAMEGLGIKVKNPQGLAMLRECGKCKWCPGPPEAVPCNWRFGMYTRDMFPPQSKAVVHALNPRTMGYPVIVVQPIHAGTPFPQRTVKWMSLMSLRVPVVVLDAAAHKGGVIRLIMTPDQNRRQEIMEKLDFLMPTPDHVPPPPIKEIVGLDGNPFSDD
jgi:hypothetical protein